MTNQEAKFILGVYRPNGADAGHATFGAALAQARSDPVLGAWFGREQAHATVVAAKLREIAPPPGLREAILAGARLSATPAHARRLPVWLGLAAGVAVLVAVGAAFWPNRGEAETKRLAAFVLDDAAHARHGGRGAPAIALQTMLSQVSVRLGDGVPMDFAALQSTGCRTLRVEGHDMIEVCFARDGREFHFYVVRRADFPALPEHTAPVFADKDGMTVASWSDATRHYVVASDGGRTALQGLL
jgi:hypothetical protein